MNWVAFYHSTWVHNFYYAVEKNEKTHAIYVRWDFVIACIVDLMLSYTKSIYGRFIASQTYVQQNQ